MRMSIRGWLKAVLIGSVLALAVVSAAGPVEARRGCGHGGGEPIVGRGNMLGGFSKGAFTGEGFTGGGNASDAAACNFEAHPLGVTRPAQPIIACPNEPAHAAKQSSPNGDSRDAVLEFWDKAKSSGRNRPIRS
jgi:hypothetical protein